jgi:hypothetical protein
MSMNAFLPDGCDLKTAAPRFQTPKIGSKIGGNPVTKRAIYRHAIYNGRGPIFGRVVGIKIGVGVGVGVG